MPIIRLVILSLFASIAVVSCYPPQVQYATTKLVSSRRDLLCENLLKLLPEKQRKLPEARAEARWLADTSYKAAAGIARVNKSNFPGWSGNALVNTRMQDRGLCWHYQHDMYRELRRRKLSFYRLGCCVRDKKKRSEHNCIYIAARDGVWPQVWVLDAWMWNGRLKVSYGPDMDQKRWEDLKCVEDILSFSYREGHNIPIEHWLVMRGINGKYDYFYSENVVNSPQSRRMRENIKKGYREHPGSPTNY